MRKKKETLHWLWLHYDDIPLWMSFLGLFFVILFQLVDRIFFDSGVMITEELSRFLFMWSCFLGLPVILKNNQELRLTMLIDKLGKKGRTVYEIIVMIGTIVLFLFLAYWGKKVMGFQAKNIMPAMRFSMKYQYLAYVVAMYAGVIRAVEKLVRLCLRLHVGTSKEVSV